MRGRAMSERDIILTIIWIALVLFGVGVAMYIALRRINDPVRARQYARTRPRSEGKGHQLDAAEVAHENAKRHLDLTGRKARGDKKAYERYLCRLLAETGRMDRERYRRERKNPIKLESTTDE